METTKLDDNLSWQVAVDGPVEIVKSRISEYCKDFQSATDGLESLAKLSGVSTRTLWRIFGGESKRPYPSTVLALYKAFSGVSSDEGVMETLEPELKKYLTHAVDFRHMEEDIVEGSQELTNDILNDSSFRQILVLIQTRDVATSEIKEKFGLHGLGIIKALQSYNMATVKDEVVRPTDKIIELPTEATYKISKDLFSNFYQLQTADSSTPHCHYFQFGRLNQVAYNEICKIDKKAYEEKNKIFRERSNQGNIPAWTISSVATTDDAKKKVLQ